MELEAFLQHVKERKPLNTPEIYEFMNRASDEARRITFELNGAYHSMPEVRDLFARLFGKPVDPSFRVFPPFYTDFGKNITVGKNVFINACCHFQDQGGITLGDNCLVGHNVVFATLNHGFAPEERQSMLPAPIVVGRNVWIGSNSTILQGVTIGDNSIIAAGSVVCGRIRGYQGRTGQCHRCRRTRTIHPFHQSGGGKTTKTGLKGLSKKTSTFYLIRRSLFT